MSEKVEHSPLPWGFTRSDPAWEPDVIYITAPGEGSNRETEIGTLYGPKKEANARLLKAALSLPKGSNADEWELLIVETSPQYAAVHIAERIDTLQNEIKALKSTEGE